MLPPYSHVYRGVKVLEIEDMEGENRLVHLILSNSIDFVVYRYLSSELLVLQVCASVFYHVCVCVCVCVCIFTIWPCIY